jgi:hypothetical protein
MNMDCEARLLSWGALDFQGLHNPGGKTPWKDGRNDPSRVERNQVLAQPFRSFGKLALADRLAFGAAALALSGTTEGNAPATGISLGIPWGSLSTDLAFRDSIEQGYPSPALFSSTLPSSALTEVAIFFGLKGPNRTLADENGAGLMALALAMKILRRNRADAMLALFVRAAEPAARLREGLPDLATVPDASYAFLLERCNEFRHPGKRLHLRLNPVKHGARSSSDDVYFREVIDMLDNEQDGTLSLTTGRWEGKLTVETRRA